MALSAIGNVHLKFGLRGHPQQQNICLVLETNSRRKTLKNECFSLKREGFNDSLFLCQ